MPDTRANGTPSRIEMVIRPVRPDEYETAGALVESAYRELLQDALGDGYADHIRNVRWRAERSDVYVAASNERLLGCVTYVADISSPLAEGLLAGEAEIRMLAVDPDSQGLGVGRALAAHCIELARQQGAVAVFLHSTAEMQIAHHIYQSLGFVRTPQRDDEPEPGVLLLGFRLEF